MGTWSYTWSLWSLSCRLLRDWRWFCVSTSLRFIFASTLNLWCLVFYLHWVDGLSSYSPIWSKSSSSIATTRAASALACNPWVVWYRCMKTACTNGFLASPWLFPWAKNFSFICGRAFIRDVDMSHKGRGGILLILLTEQQSMNEGIPGKVEHVRDDQYLA